MGQPYISNWQNRWKKGARSKLTWQGFHFDLEV